MKYIVAGNQLEKIGSVENLIAWVGTGAYLARGSSCAGVLRRDLCLRGSHTELRIEGSLSTWLKSSRKTFSR